jgi:hypothetical protein
LAPAPSPASAIRLGSTPSSGAARTRIETPPGRHPPRPGTGARPAPGVDRQHPGRDLAGEKPARLVVGVEVADHVTPAVVVDDERPSSGAPAGSWRRPRIGPARNPKLAHSTDLDHPAAEGGGRQNRCWSGPGADNQARSQPVASPRTNRLGRTPDVDRGPTMTPSSG